MEFTKIMRGRRQRKGCSESLSTQRQVEALLERMALDAAESLREPLGIAVIASPGNLGATSDGVPCRIRPLDSGILSHQNSRIGRKLGPYYKQDDTELEEKFASA